MPYLEKSGLSGIDPDHLDQIASVSKENLVVLSQIGQYLGIFFDEKFSFDAEARKILLDSKNRETVSAILRALQGSPEITSDGWPLFLSQLAEKTGRKGRNLYAPFRAAITGTTKGPELIHLLPILGQKRMIDRLKMALALF